MKKSVFLTAILIVAVCSVAAAERKDCSDPGNGACFEPYQGFSCNWDGPEDFDQNGIVDHWCAVTDGFNDFFRANPKGKFFYHFKEHDGYFEYCPFPIWDYTPDRADECYYGTGDLLLNYWFDPRIEGWSECPALVTVKGFGTRPDGEQIAVDSTWQTLKKRGQCELHKFWIDTVP